MYGDPPKVPARRALLAALSLLSVAVARAENCSPDPNCKSNGCTLGSVPSACSVCKVGFGLYGGLVPDAKCCPANIEADHNGACTANVCQDPNCDTCSAPATCTTCKTGYQLTSSDGCATLDSDNDGIPDVVEGEVDTGTTTFALFFLFFKNIASHLLCWLLCLSPFPFFSYFLSIFFYFYLLSIFFSLDGDGAKDKDDTDSDGDGISDAQESGAQTSTLNSMTKNCALQAYHEAKSCGCGNENDQNAVLWCGAAYATNPVCDDEVDVSDSVCPGGKAKLLTFQKNDQNNKVSTSFWINKCRYFFHAQVRSPFFFLQLKFRVLKNCVSFFF